MSAIIASSKGAYAGLNQHEVVDLSWWQHAERQADWVCLAELKATNATRPLMFVTIATALYEAR